MGRFSDTHIPLPARLARVVVLRLRGKDWRPADFLVEQTRRVERTIANFLGHQTVAGRTAQILIVRIHLVVTVMID